MSRHKYQALFKAIGEKSAELRKKTIMIIGAGGLGSTIADMLHREGLCLRIVDKDRIYFEEIQRLSLYEEDDENKFKAKQIKKRLEMVDFKNKVRTFHEELEKENAFLLDSADLVIDCSNNLETMTLVGTHAKKKISLISCKYSGSEGAIFISNKKHNYKEVADKFEKIKDIETNGIINAACHFAAGIIVSQALKILVGESAEDNFITFDVWDNKVKKTKL